MQSRRKDTVLRMNKTSQMQNSRIRILSSNPFAIAMIRIIIVRIRNLPLLKIEKKRLNANTFAPLNISRLSSRKIVRNSQKGNRIRKGRKAHNRKLFSLSTIRKITKKKESKFSRSRIMLTVPRIHDKYFSEKLFSISQRIVFF